MQSKTEVLWNPTYSILRTTHTAPYGTQFVMVTLFKGPAGPVRIEIYQVDESGLEMFLQYANPDLIGVLNGHGLCDAPLIMHMAELEQRGYKLTPLADWPRTYDRS